MIENKENELSLDKFECRELLVLVVDRKKELYSGFYDINNFTYIIDTLEPIEQKLVDMIMAFEDETKEKAV